jgi:Xaa-Pro aminopeptidase
VKTASEFELRQQKLREVLSLARVDAMIVLALPNVRYLSGFTGSNGALLITADRELLFTDARYQIQAPAETDCDIKIVRGSLANAAMKWAQRLRVTRVGFERNRISYEGYQDLKSRPSKSKEPIGRSKAVVRGSTVSLKGLDGVVEGLRMLKSDTEVQTVRTAVLLNSEALEQGLKHVKPGMTEIDLAAEIEFRMRRLGADGPSFETIVASGPRTALPHARPTAREIQPNQLLLIDMGATVAGYASDMTRTFAVGSLSAKAKRIYHAVLESQLAAIDAIRPGVTANAVDQAARRVLRRCGYDKLFIHSTGHGLGLEIHEGPRIGKRVPQLLESGMVITVEPGVYEEGLGGVRIEDTVVVTPAGHDVLTPTGKDLRVL